MMDEWLSKEALIHRDNAGNLLPIAETVEYLEGKPKIKLVPLTRGEIQGLESAEGSDDKALLKNHLLAPKLTDEELEQMSLRDIHALLWALLSASTGFPQATFRERTLALTTNFDDLLKKKEKEK